MKRFIIILPLLVLAVSLGFVGCAGSSPAGSTGGFFFLPGDSRSVAVWLKHCPNINWLPRQVSGRYDGASAQDNINQAALGLPAKRSSYGTAPGGFVRLDHRMLHALRVLAKEGYRFRVTAIAGASHSRKSLHYDGVAFDVDHLNGMKIGYGHPHWRKFLHRCRQLGATETFGPGDPGHSSHIHAAWSR